jgi:hypothetical protein
MTREIKLDIPTGTRPSTCRGCQATIYWLVTEKGKRMPVDPDGTPHWATCPNAQEFRRRKRGAGNH